MKPYDATQKVFKQQFGNRTVKDHKGVEQPVFVFYNLDDNGKHPVTGEDVPEAFVATGQVIIAGPAESVIEASGVLYGYSVGLGGYVVLNAAGEFPGIVSRFEAEPGSIPQLQDVLKVVTNWYPTTPINKQGISISFTKNQTMITPDTHVVLSRDVDLNHPVALISRQTLATDDLDYVPELLLVRLNASEPNESYSTIIDSAFDVINSMAETTAVYYLNETFHELCLTVKENFFEFYLVQKVRGYNRDAMSVTCFESKRFLASCDEHFDFTFSDSYSNCGHSMHGLLLQLENILTQRGFTRVDD